MSPASSIYTHQKLWALRNGIGFDDSGYTRELHENLFEPLSMDAISQFEFADGQELRNVGTHRAKMRALHSSSALAVNVFHYWLQRDKAPLAKAMEIPSTEIESIRFERVSPIANNVDRTSFPKDPNIDVVINYRQGPIREIGIESKFSEAYGEHDGLRQAYTQRRELWEGLPACLALAERIVVGGKVTGLNTPQLLKHLLSLKHRPGIGKFWLVYLWYASQGPELGMHYQQLEEFKRILAEDRVRFHYLTYQELICRLGESVRSDHQRYVDYLAERYL